jgi:hypothetical protein
VPQAGNSLIMSRGFAVLMPSLTANDPPGLEKESKDQALTRLPVKDISPGRRLVMAPRECAPGDFLCRRNQVATGCRPSSEVTCIWESSTRPHANSYRSGPAKEEPVGALLGDKLDTDLGRWDDGGQFYQADDRFAIDAKVEATRAMLIGIGHVHSLPATKH